MPDQRALWDKQTLLYAGLAIVVLLVLYEAQPAWGGLLVVAVIFILVARGLRSGNLGRIA